MKPVPPTAKVLVVDDDAVCGEILCRVLAEAGYPTTHAVNGKAALVRLWAEPFALVVTDIMMAERDGFELIQQVLRDFPGMGIVAISGLDPFGVDVLQMAKLLGAHATLRKPCDPGLLQTTVATVLGELRPHDR